MTRLRPKLIVFLVVVFLAIRFSTEGQLSQSDHIIEVEEGVDLHIVDWGGEVHFFLFPVGQRHHPYTMSLLQTRTSSK